MVSLQRRALESLYIGRCTINGTQKVKDQATGKTSTNPVTVVVDEPCKLSFKTISAGSTADPVTTLSQAVILFIAPEVEVKEGSSITVCWQGRELEYESSGKPAIYGSHQEIPLKLSEDHG